MKVKELIEKLKKLDQEKAIYISKDEEGNEFKEVDCITPARGEETNDGNVIEGYIIYPCG